MKHSMLLGKMMKRSLLLAVIAMFAVTGCSSRGSLFSSYAGAAGATGEQVATGNTGVPRVVMAGSTDAVDLAPIAQK